MFLVLLLTSFVGLAIGLTISAVARTSEVAVALLPLVLLPLVMLAGALQPLHEMNRTGRALAQAMPSRWTFESLLVLEADQRPLWTPPALATPAGTPNTSEHPPQDMAEKHFPADSERMGARAGTLALAGMLVALIMLTNAILRMRDVHTAPAKPRQTGASRSYIRRTGAGR